MVIQTTYKSRLWVMIACIYDDDTISYGLNMANASSTLVEKLNRDFLECGICLDRFQKPRALPCLHSFCHCCLESFCKGKQQVLCPNCKRLIEVPEEGVSGFPAHFMVNNLQETLDKETLKVIHSWNNSQQNPRQKVLGDFSNISTA